MQPLKAVDFQITRGKKTIISKKQILRKSKETMAETVESQLHSPCDQSKFNLEHHVIQCPIIGKINVYLQGQRTNNEVVIMTMHDLGCNYNMYQDFIDHPRMVPIRDRTVWLHLEVPGQGFNAPDLPPDYQFPTMQIIAEDLIKVLDDLNIKEVVCFGEGAGANILARFAMANIKKVLGVCLLHTTGTTAGLFDSLKDKMMSWKLDTIGMNPSAEHYLVLHRFGGTEFNEANDNEELKTIVESYQDVLRSQINPKNLKQFVNAFLKRTNIADNIKALKCPVLLVTGQHSIFNATTRSLHQAILKSCSDKTKVEFIEVANVANVLEEKPDKLAECFQYFLQGLGLVSSIPMHNVHKMLRYRTMSMEDYDRPRREQFASTNSTSFDIEGPTFQHDVNEHISGNFPPLLRTQYSRKTSASPPNTPSRVNHPIGTLAEES